MKREIVTGEIFHVLNRGVDNREIFLDEEKPRILVSKKTVKKNKNKIINLGLVPAIVVEYPTADQLEIEVDFLKNS